MSNFLFWLLEFSILLIEKDFDLDCEKLTNIDMPVGIEIAESGNYIKSKNNNFRN